ncbi:right-handed parallel beta-helix repeat-containing protein [Streptomyces sp. NPDC058411]|uniref:right-handed parallel beta-helix repeat-containing protein n=1 Tax=Streptomyces sp. NPDC058411 TaxID=3346485 RepID=UPI0036503CA5
MKRTRGLAATAALATLSAPLGLITVGAGAAQAASRTYFVSPSGNDGNPGTSTGSPFRTIQKAADTAGPGDTVSIMNGTYTERSKGSDVVSITRSGRPGAPITFTAAPGHHPVVHAVRAWNAIAINGASYITVRGLEIKGNNKALTLAAAERGANKTDPTFNTNCLSVERNRSTGALSHDIVVSGNEVHDCAGGGIATMNADHLTITDNHVYSTSWYTVYGTSGISVLTPRDTSAGDAKTYKIRITGNRVHDNETRIRWEKCGCYSDGNGIIIDTLKGDAGHPAYRGRVLVANNVSYDNGGSGIHSYKSQHVDIVHNTAYMNGRSTRMDSYANIFAHDSTDVRLLDNISYGRPGQATNSKARNVDVTYDHNVYYGGKAPEIKGAHDLVADPKFIAPGTGQNADFRLRKGSPAIGSGTPFAAVTTDITGARRTTGAPDLGAYGYGAEGRTQSTGDNSGESASPTSGSEAEKPGEPRTDGAPGSQTAAGSGEGSGVKADGGRGPLAETGGSDPVLPLGLAAAGLAVGGGLLFALRRKRS